MRERGGRRGLRRRQRADFRLSIKYRFALEEKDENGERIATRVLIALVYILRFSPSTLMLSFALCYE